MQKAQDAKLGLLALLTVSHSLRGRGEIQMFGRNRFLSRMRGWARLR